VDLTFVPPLKATIANRFERNFATNAALTSKIIGIGIARSHFGPTDSWVIKTVGAGSFCRGTLTWARFEGVSWRCGFAIDLASDHRALKKSRFAGD
jgi:hypothetical protein